MSRRVRNWCDICRDLEPDIKCTNEGCAKKYHEACLRNIGLWQPDDKRDSYICPDCRESSINDSFCYICKKELIMANDKRKRQKKSKPASPSISSPTTPASAKRDTPLSEDMTEAEEEPDDQESNAADDVSSGVDDEDDTEEEAEPASGTMTDDTSKSNKKKGSPEEEQSETSVSQRSHRPRRSARQAANRAAAAGNKSSSSEEADEEDDGKAEKKASTRKLKKVDVCEDDDFLLCDGCVNSAHIRCLGLADPPSPDDLWFCTDCDPHSATAASLARSAAEKKEEAMKQSSSNAANKTRLGNVDICYVCQKSGKLLGCDFCEQSFHPRCIDAEFLEFEKAPLNDASESQNAEAPNRSEGLSVEKWRCPICKGEDPLKNMAHKRMSRTAMLKLSREWQSCIKQTHRACKSNRDQFLWSCRNALVPFISEKTLSKLAKSVGASEADYKKRRNGKTRRGRQESEEDASDTRARDKEEADAHAAFREAEKAAADTGQSILKEGVLLKGYQVIGVGWLLNAFKHKAGAILADEMGLGKTIQCLAFLSALKAMGITGPHLIVVPLSTVGNWAREIRRFIPHMRFVKICGSRFERDHIVADPTAAQGLYDLYITTYETVVTEESFFCDSFSWQCLILDEAHRIKNESGRIRHSLDRVSANMRTLLTGTPLQNNVKELFTLLNFLFPDILKDSNTFEQVFAGGSTAVSISGGGSATGGAVDAQNLGNDEMDESAVQAVSSLLSKMMLRRTKDLVVKLPKKLEHEIWLPLSAASAYWYNKLLQVSEAETISQQVSVKKLLGTVVKMRICCCHPRGLVTRDFQLKRFREVFQGLGPVEEAAVSKAASELLDLTGEEHIKTSSKLMALDKLLCHLHLQNIQVSTQYREDFVQNCKDLYIQSHPLEPIVHVRVPRARSGLTSSEPPSVKGADGEISQTPSLPNDDSASVVDSIKIEDSFVKTELKAEPKPLSSRQQAERLRKERAAALAAQQAQLDATLDVLGQDVLTRIKPQAEDPALFWSFMADADVPEDTEVLRRSPLVAPDCASQEDECDDDTASEGEDGASPPPANPHGVDSPIVDVTASSAVVEETAVPPAPKAEPPKQYHPHKVLVFTQFQLVLDELEAYCRFRGFRYLRLDGSTNKMLRELDIREFNSASSTHLVYLICTRAGGVGINLVTANHVILYDEDWNPFIDLQAIDRAHRIGQKRDVHVWKLITEWTVEERMAFRRRQKLKLDRLLIHANTAKSGGANIDPVVEEDDFDHSGDKFSIDEIRKLITHGKSAIQKACQADNSELWDEPLESMISRPRQPLPALEEELEQENEMMEDKEEEELPEKRVSLAEVLDPEERAECLVGTVGAPGTVSRTSTDDGDGADADMDETVETEDGERKRSRRLRKRIPVVFQQAPQMQPKVKQERKIIHDKKCFKCGSGVNPSDEQADPLVPCHRCPKVYHRSGCLHMDELPRKTWTCPWHECCLCFRKGSQAGGLLIHCAECPTAFCFDCFPPEYRRYTPPATYYSELTRRGFHVTPDKLVLFLCSRCKALKEQQRRRMLSKQQLDLELKRRREANMKAKLDAQKVAITDKNGAVLDRRNTEAKKEFLARKRVIDDTEREWSRDIRTYYENLFPALFLEVLKIKRQKQADEKSAAKAPPSQSQEAQPEGEGSQPTAPRPGAGSGKVIVAKMPSEFCKVCDNCHLPGHESQQCPFPPETEKRHIGQLSNNTAAPDDEVAAERVRNGTKRLTRSFCPKCGVSSRNHFRRHCEQLEPQEVEEYAERKGKILKFIEALKQAQRVEVPTGMSITPTTAESCRRILQRKVDDIVASCLASSGLGNCVAASHARSGVGLHQTLRTASQTKGRRRRRNDEELDNLSGVETDDPNYSPRKRSREADDDEAAQIAHLARVALHGHSTSQDDRKRRRPLPNFVELAGGGDGMGTIQEEDYVAADVMEPYKRHKGTSKSQAPELQQSKGTAKKKLEPGEKGNPTNSQLSNAHNLANESRRFYEVEAAKRRAYMSDRFGQQPSEQHPMSQVSHLPQFGAAMAGAPGSRLPPSRWHAHPTAQILGARLPLSQPLYPGTPGTMWMPQWAGAFPQPNMMMPSGMKWPWMPPPNTSYPPYSFVPPQQPHPRVSPTQMPADPNANGRL